MYVGWPGLVSFLLFQVLSPLLTLYFWIVIIAAVMTWINPDPYNPIVRAIYGITEPVFDWFRAHLPVVFGGLDLSPFVVLLIIQFVQMWLLPTVGNLLINGFA